VGFGGWWSLVEVYSSILQVVLGRRPDHRTPRPTSNRWGWKNLMGLWLLQQQQSRAVDFSRSHSRLGEVDGEQAGSSSPNGGWNPPQSLKALTNNSMISLPFILERLGQIWWNSVQHRVFNLYHIKYSDVKPLDIRKVTSLEHWKTSFTYSIASRPERILDSPQTMMLFLVERFLPPSPGPRQEASNWMIPIAFNSEVMWKWFYIGVIKVWSIWS
jgi:hypothetical protein